MKEIIIVREGKTGGDQPGMSEGAVGFLHHLGDGIVRIKLARNAQVPVKEGEQLTYVETERMV